MSVTETLSVRNLRILHKYMEYTHVSDTARVSYTCVYSRKAWSECRFMTGEEYGTGRNVHELQKYMQISSIREV